MTADATGGAPATAGRGPLRPVARLVAVVFLLVGVLGFVPGITSDYGDLSFAGHMSGAKLVGLFQVSVLHNLVHLLFGVVGLLASRSLAGARSYLVVGGVVYAVLWVYGLFEHGMSAANFVPLNTADNWLHLVLAVGMVGLGLALGRRATAGPVEQSRHSGVDRHST